MKSKRRWNYWEDDGPLLDIVRKQCLKAQSNGSKTWNDGKHVGWIGLDVTSGSASALKRLKKAAADSPTFKRPQTRPASSTMGICGGGCVAEARHEIHVLLSDLNESD